MLGVREVFKKSDRIVSGSQQLLTWVLVTIL